MKQNTPPRREIPIWHILVGLSGWVFLLLLTNWGTLLLAVTLSALALPRFIRGSWDKADARITRELRTPSRPSRQVARVISDDEQLLWETHEHPISLFFWMVAAILLQTLTVVVATYIGLIFASILWTLGMIVVGVKIYLREHDRLCLTNRRLLALRGIMRVRHESMPLNKLTDETLQIPWHSNVLAWLRIIQMQYGTLIVESAGQDQALSRVVFVPNAIQLNRIVMGKALS